MSLINKDLKTTPSVLRDVVTLGGLAVQAEDCMVRAAVHHRGKRGGLIHMLNERYYQFIIWRAILPLWPVRIEREANRDLIVECADGKHYFEMKTWFSAGGNKELPGMQKDIIRLQTHVNGYLLVLAANPWKQTDDNLAYLSEKLTDLRTQAREDFRFRTQGKCGEDLEFWIAAWLVSPKTQSH